MTGRRYIKTGRGNMADKALVYSHKADKARDRAADYTKKANAMLSK